MIFYHSYFWIFFLVTTAIVWSMNRPSQRALAILCLSFLVIMISGPLNIIVILALIFTMMILKKYLPAWIAFLCTLIAFIALKSTLDLGGSLPISFIGLSLLGLLYRQSTPTLNDVSKSLAFPLLPVGPIVRSEDIAERDSFSEAQMKKSVLTLLAGFVCLSIGSSQFKVIGTPLHNLADLFNHFFAVLNLMFLNFQGAVLIALSCADLLGLSIEPNFYKPYAAKTMREFWGRWHISMGRFFSEHIYQPLQLLLLQKEHLPSPVIVKLFQIFALIFTWQLIAFWHKWTVIFAVWGLYNAFMVLLPAERWKLNNVGVTLVLIYFSHMLFLSQDWNQFQHFVSSLAHLKMSCSLSSTIIVAMTVNVFIFLLSQKMFDWEKSLCDYLVKHSLLYYLALLVLFFISLVYYYKGQFIIYGQF